MGELQRQHRRSVGRFALLIASAAALAGCGKGSGKGTAAGDSGTIHAALSFRPADGVSAVQLDVSRGGALAATRTVSIPGNIPDGGPAADAFFVLPPGTYTVTATALDAAGRPNGTCMSATTTAVVAAGQSTEVTLALLCGGPGNGGLDVVVTAEHTPVITNLTFDPNKFVTSCEPATITVTASSPDGLAIMYAWTVTSAPGATDDGGAVALPPGVGMLLTASGNRAIFDTATAGDYSVKVTVTDSNGRATSLTFPIHVLGGDGCAPTPRSSFAANVQNLFGLASQASAPAFTDVGPNDPLFATVQAVAPFLNRQLLCFGCALGSRFLPAAATNRGQDAVLITSVLVARGALALLSPADADAALAAYADGASIPPPARPIIATALSAGVLTPLPGGLIATGVVDTSSGSGAMLARAQQIVGGAP